MSEKVLLKKYPNRRLYNTEKSVYVTLNQVSDIIKEGRQVQVVDAKTDEDVTAFILTQIIVEEAKKKNALLPSSLLHLVICYGENILNEFFQKYLELTINNYLSYKSSLDDQFKMWLRKGMDLSTFSPGSVPPFMSLDSLMELFSEALKQEKKNE